MARRTLVAAAAVVGAAALLFLTPTGRIVSQSLHQVIVTNFPEVQAIEGRVTLAEPIRVSTLRRFENLTVPPVRPTDSTRLFDAGKLVTDGFPSVVLSLHGQTKGSVLKPGVVGAILVPDEPMIQQAFTEDGLMHFKLEIASHGVNADTPYFASDQPRLTVGFPTYRVWLYNTTDKAVTVNLFAYLTQ